MLETIKDFLQNIGDMLLSLWDLAIGFFEDIAYLVKLLTAFVAKIPQYLSWLPAEVVTLFVAGLAIVLVLRVVGRD